MLWNESPAFAPLRTLYRFNLSLTDHFAVQTVGLTESESQHLRSQISIGRKWSTVTVVFEDWRSHLVVKVKEHRSLTGGEAAKEMVLAPFIDGPEWAHERRTGEQLIYAHELDDYDPVTLWRRYLSPELEEFLELQLVETHLQFAAYGGRFGSVPMPDYTHPASGNTYLRLPVHPRRLTQYAVPTEPSLSMFVGEGIQDVPIPAWRKVFMNTEANGIQWSLDITDLQAFLESESE